MNASFKALPLLALAAAACAAPRADDPPPLAGPTSAQADLRDSAGRVRAMASVTQMGDSLRIRVQAQGLAPGAYGAHVHAVGRCDPPGFESAGPHWNPTDREHGSQNPQGQHMGDLPNLIVGANGEGSFEYTVPGAWVGGGATAALLDGDGASVVVHASADDYRTDPSGNSGARIACGVLG